MCEFLNNYDSFYNDVDDILYYYIYDDTTKSRAYVFSEYNSLFSDENNIIVGKCFYLNSPKIIIDEMDYKTKNISGERYINMGYRKKGNDYVVNPDRSIQSFVLNNNLFSVAKSKSIFATNYSVFETKNIVGVSEPKKSLQVLYKKNNYFRKIVNNITRNFRVNIDDLGLTGSLALGSKIGSDYDIVFYGDLSRINLIKEKIDYFIKKNGFVREYGVNWPCRYYDDDYNLICCFFNCTDPIYVPHKDAQIIKEDYGFKTRIIDDTFSLLKAPILKIDNSEIDNVLLLNSGLRGMLKKGDIISGVGKIIQYDMNKKTKYSILCTNPYDEVKSNNDFIF